MTELIGLGLGLIKDLFGGFSQIVKAKQDRELAALENQARLLRDEQSHNSAWEMASLRDADKWLRRISFAIFSFPIVYAAVNPTGVAFYFNTALAALPDWYVKTYMGIIGGIWGIASLKDAIPAIVNQVRTWKNPDLN